MEGYKGKNFIEEFENNNDKEVYMGAVKENLFFSLIKKVIGENFFSDIFSIKDFFKKFFFLYYDNGEEYICKILKVDEKMKEINTWDEKKRENFLRDIDLATDYLSKKNPSILSFTEILEDLQYALNIFSQK
jgi:hypothetical protein